jgi:hypothetical protein
VFPTIEKIDTKMKFTLVVCAFLASSVAAFAPVCNEVGRSVVVKECTSSFLLFENEKFFEWARL